MCRLIASCSLCAERRDSNRKKPRMERAAAITATEVTMLNNPIGIPQFCRLYCGALMDSTRCRNLLLAEKVRYGFTPLCPSYMAHLGYALAPSFHCTSPSKPAHSPNWMKADSMANAANSETRRNEPMACPVCQRVPLMLFRLFAGKIEHARVGCLCRSLIVRPDADQNRQPLHQSTRHSRLL